MLIGGQQKALTINNMCGCSIVLQQEVLNVTAVAYLMCTTICTTPEGLQAM